MSKKIRLKMISLKNFKGVKELVVNFEAVTNVYGDNGTGKTTIFDAFTWLLFDKDSNDRKCFEIKTLDINNEVVHGLEHSVAGVLLVEDREVKLAKVYKEKWTKKKGETKRIFTGNETFYFVDDLPMRQGEYQNKISSFIDEAVFKLITNPLYFNLNMTWKQRRDIILQITGDIPVSRILNCKKDLKRLEKLLEDKDIELLKKSIVNSKKKLIEEVKAIPYRIDEINNSVQELDFISAKIQLKQYEASLKEVEDKLLDSCKVSERVLKNRDKLYELKDKLVAIELQANTEAAAPLKLLYANLSSVEKEILSLESSIDKIDYAVKNKEIQIVQIEKQLMELRERWEEVKEELLIIPEDSFICPTCKRTLEIEDIEKRKKELQQNFDEDKWKRLFKINDSGKDCKDKLNCISEEIQRLAVDKTMLSKQLQELLPKKKEIENRIEIFSPIIDFSKNEEYETMKEEILSLENILKQPSDVSEEVDKWKERKIQLIKKIDECKKILQIKQQNSKFIARIKELSECEKALTAQIAELESQELLCEEFIKTKVELLESSINKKFKFVNFKLFNNLINGSVEECCEALINGVPFSNANKASQINAGLDIINALSEHYGVAVPIIIDNRESINNILDCSSQIINLIVSKDEKIKIESSENDYKSKAGMMDKSIYSNGIATMNVGRGIGGPDF